MKKILKYQKYLWTIMVYGFYLLTLPYFNQIFYPCLKFIPEAAYEYKTCNLYLVLDRFMIMALIGFALEILYLFWQKSTRKWVFIIIASLILTAITIFGYLQYIKIAEGQIRNAPIYLDSLPKIN